MTGGEYDFRGLQALEVLSTKFNAIADIVNDAIRSLLDEHRVDVQPHYIPFNENGGHDIGYSDATLWKECLALLKPFQRGSSSGERGGARWRECCRQSLTRPAKAPESRTCSSNYGTILQLKDGQCSIRWTSRSTHVKSQVR